MTPGFILNAWLFNGAGALSQDVATLDPHTLTLPKEGFLWVNLDAASSAAREWCTIAADVPDIAVDSLFAPETRPRSTLIGKAGLMNLRGVNLNPDSDPEDMVSIRLWIVDHLVVSTRFRRLMALEDLLASYGGGMAPHTVGEFIGSLSLRLTQRMEGVILDLSEQLDGLEDEAVEGETVPTRAPLAQLRRKAIILRRYIAPQREAINRLVLDAPAWVNHKALVALREASDGVTRHVEELDALRERAMLVQEQISDARAERMKRQMMVLSVVAALFLPLSFLTGLLGINVGGIPGVEWPYSFAAVCAVCAILGGLLLWWFKRRGWL